MLTTAENDRLTKVGPGTPMGALFRRYWLPIAISSQLGSRPLAKRLLGEDLVVFRTRDGRVGVVEERCAHRRTSLTVGVCEKTGIRCGYHGWVYDLEGRCIEQPAEPALNKQVRITAYPAQELGGLVFVYMGPAPAPELPRFDLFVVEDVIRDIGETTLDFNWLQAMENSVDPHHVEWLHGAFMNEHRAQSGGKGFEYTTRKHKKVGFTEFEYGIIKRRVLEGGSEEDDDWKIGHPLIFPYMLKVGTEGSIAHFQMRVPIDDVHTWHLWYTTYRPKMPMPMQGEVPGYHVPLRDADGNWTVDTVDGQDISVWAEQGRIADRTKEVLGASDRGIAMFRRMLLRQIDVVENGGDPLGTIRDPSKAAFIPLPIERDKHGAQEAYTFAMLHDVAQRYSPLNQTLIRHFGFDSAE